MGKEEGEKWKDIFGKREAERKWGRSRDTERWGRKKDGIQRETKPVNTRERGITKKKIS